MNKEEDKIHKKIIEELKKRGWTNPSINESFAKELIIDTYRILSTASQPKVDIQQSCEHCKHFTLNTYEDNYKSEMGNCKYQVKFPDSTYARCAGTKKTMNKRDGRNCPCYEAI